VNHKLISACLISLAIVGHRALAATITVTTTNDSGAGSLRTAITTANATVVQDTISFNISGTGPFTITPATALPTITNSVVIDGYTQPGASQNTLASGDNAVIEIAVTGTFGTVSLDTSNTTVRGLSVSYITTSAQPSPKGGYIIQGNFIGVDPTGTNSLGAPTPGISVNCPNMQIGGTTPAARNIISGHGATGIEMAGSFATGTIIQGNYVGTDRTGTKSIGNQDRAIICNSFAQSNTIGGTVPGAGNLVSGNLDRGIVLDGTNEVAQGNFIGVDANGNPLGNARSGVEIAGSNNVCGGTAAGAGNIIWNNGVNGGGNTTNGVDVQNGITVFGILGNSIFNNAGLGIDLKEDELITPGYPTITVATNSPSGTVVSGKAPTNGAFRLELFSNPVCDPSGYGEGKTLILSTMVTPLVNSNFTVTVSPAVAPGLFITATANGMTEFSPCQTVMLGGSTNSWTNSVSGRWDNGTNWSLGAAPFITLSAILITNANSKTITIDSNTAANFPGTMSVSNLTIGAPGASINTLSLANVGTLTPLDVVRSCIVSNGGAMTFNNSILQVNGLSNGVASFDGPVTFNGGSLITSNAQVTYIGNSGQGSLALSNATFESGHLVVGGSSPGAQGTFSLANTTANLNALMEVANDSASTGILWLANSSLEIDGPVYLGFLGSGQMTVSNSTVSMGSIDLGSQTGSHGTYTGVNSTNIFGYLLIGEEGVGSVTLIGGAMIESNFPSYVGESGSGLLSVNNTTLLTPSIMLGSSSGSTGQFIFAGGSMVLTNLIPAGTMQGAVSTLLVTGGQLTLPDPTILISTSSYSRVTVSNGTLHVNALTVIPSATAGSLTVAGGGLNVIGGDLTCIGPGTALWLTGGQVTVTNGNAFAGQIAISNGTFMAHDFFIGNSGFGTVTVAGGAVVMTSGGNGLVVGNGSATSTVWMTGGKLVATNAVISVGGLFSPATGNIIASNGTVQASDVLLGAESGGAGTFTVAGGVHSIYSSLVLGGDFCVGGTGVVNVSGGQLFVTNAAHDAVLDVETGTLNVNGGYVQADIIILSNSCAHYAYSSGQIVYGNAFLNPNRDDDGDGIPNGYEIKYGLNALNPENATLDTDGDGMSDLAEYLAGTDPTNPASVFRITSVVRTNNNMRITWTTVGGHTNRVYVDTGATNGSYDGVFGNLSPFIIIPGTNASTTNYIDVGGATNVPARYYRIRLIP
jgi:hypothetical protein